MQQVFTGAPLYFRYCSVCTRAVDKILPYVFQNVTHTHTLFYKRKYKDKSETNERNGLAREKEEMGMRGKGHQFYTHLSHIVYIVFYFWN